MNVLIISHKETWCDPASSSGYVTGGGFPYHVNAIASLFESTSLIVTLRSSPLPKGAQPILAKNLKITALPEPGGSNLHRKLAILIWLPKYLSIIWREIQQADAVHALVPGDIGFIGLFIALLQHKPLFVRHCGTWGRRATLADHFLLRLLEKAAGGKNVVLATGWAATSPSKRNRNIHWIFSTTLTNAELSSMPVAQSWHPSHTLRLVTVGRLAEDKNIQAIIQSLPLIQNEFHEKIVLEIVGDGQYRSALEKLALELGVKHQVIFHGNVKHKDVLEILSKSHVFVFPSFREGFPKAVLEALACGLPIVATNVSVIPFLIRDSGVVLEVPDAQHISAAVLGLLEKPECLPRLSSQARQMACRYTLETWQKQIEDHLRAAWKVDLCERA